MVLIHNFRSVNNSSKSFVAAGWRLSTWPDASRQRCKKVSLSVSGRNKKKEILKITRRICSRPCSSSWITNTHCCAFCAIFMYTKGILCCVTWARDRRSRRRRPGSRGAPSPLSPERNREEVVVFFFANSFHLLWS